MIGEPKCSATRRLSSVLPTPVGPDRMRRVLSIKVVIGVLHRSVADPVKTCFIEFVDIVFGIAVEIFAYVGVASFGVYLVERHDLYRCLTDRFAAYGFVQIFARDDFAEFHEESTFGHIIEDEKQLLMLVFKKLF